MKIKILTSISGADFSFAPGDETDHFDAAEVKNLIDAGFAVPVASEQRETATKKAPAKETR